MENNRSCLTNIVHINALYIIHISLETVGISRNVYVQSLYDWAIQSVMVSPPASLDVWHQNTP